MIIIYAPDRARFRPQVYTYMFITFDLIALILQAIGGAIASLADPRSSAQQAGINTMIAGVSWQVFALVVFGLLSLDFWLRVRSLHAAALNPAFAELRARRLFQPGFVLAIAAAGVFIFVRSVFRCAELSEGLEGDLANDQVTFMVLEGAMIALTSILLTVFHPGLAVGSEGWSAASWKKKQSSVEDAEKQAAESGSDKERVSAREWQL